MATNLDPWGLGTTGGYTGMVTGNQNQTNNNYSPPANVSNPYSGFTFNVNTGNSDNASQTNAPWAPSQPYILDLMARGQTMSQNPGVSSQMTGAFNGMQGALNNNLSSQAGGVIGNTLGMNPATYFGANYTNAGAANTNTVNSAVNPYLGMNNPYLTNAINSASEDAMRNMQPMFNSQNRASGSFGNSGLAEYQARTAANTLGNISNNMRYQDYTNQANLAQQNVQNMNQMGQFNASNLLNNNQFNASLANQTQGLRNSQYNQGQSVLNNAAFNVPGFNTANMGAYGQLYNTASNMNNAQWQPLQNYGSLLGSGFGSTTSYNPSSANNWLTGLGALGMGSSIFSNIFGS